MKVVPLTTALFMVFMLGACSNYATQRYSVSSDNVMALRSLKAGPIQVGKFTSTAKYQSEIQCAGVGNITTQDYESFSDYIRKALIDEIKMSGLYSPSALTVISGNLDHIETAYHAGTWDISITVKGGSGRSITASEIYHYDTSFFNGDQGCMQTAQAFVPAVQNLLNKVFSHPDFKMMIGGN